MKHQATRTKPVFLHVLGALLIPLVTTGATVPARADDLLVSSADSDEVLRYDGTTGAFIGAFVTRGSGGLARPTYLIFPAQAVTTTGIAICDDFGGLGEFGCRIVPPGAPQDLGLTITDGTASIDVEIADMQHIELIDTDSDLETIAIAVDVTNNGITNASVSMNIVLTDENGQMVGPFASANTFPFPVGFSGLVAFTANVSIENFSPVIYHGMRLDIDVVGGPITFGDFIQANIFEVDQKSNVGSWSSVNIPNDVVLNLPNPGVSVLLNDNTSSIALDPDTATAIALGDVDASGMDDVIASFPAGAGPTDSGGTWIARNGGPLTLLSTLTAEGIIAGNFTGGAGDDLFLDFGAAGLWASINGGAPFSTSVPSPVTMTTGDVDNNGQADLIASFTGFGTLVLKNLSVITVLDTSAAQTLASGDVDGTGTDDVIAAFGPGDGPTGTGGTWVSQNEGPLALLSNNTAETITAGNYTGDANDDLFLDFGAAGLWASINGGPPFSTSVPSPTAMVTGDVDSSGADDLILSVTGFGTVVVKNLAATASIAVLDAAVALDLATGNVDGN